MATKMNVSISIDWWPVAGGEVKSDHRAALKDEALMTVYSAAMDGAVCGDLNANIAMTDDDPEEGVDYRGWWKLQFDQP